MNYKFKLTTESMLLTGSGEGGVLIDADVVFHRTGFPFIPARRIKGMLRESLEEVLEMYGKDEKEINVSLEKLFGKSGNQIQSGKLQFGNLFVENWEAIVERLPEQPSSAFAPAHLRSFYTTEIQQTAIDDKGIAEDRTLRNYRVIKPHFTFEGFITANPDLSPDEWEYLGKAVDHLRHAGTRRNRGFGKIRCTIEKGAQTANAVSTQPTTTAGAIDHIAVEIKTISPVVLAQQIGEQNTVVTRRYIAGNRLRGLLAGAYILEKQLTRNNAHRDPGFREIFLSGKVQFGNLFFDDTRPIPRMIQAPKINSEPKKVVYGFYDEREDPEAENKEDMNIGLQNKAIDIIGKVDAQGNVHDIQPTTTFFFHNSRENRAAGRSTENDTEGGIFYYEAIDEDQSFFGQITGASALLRKLTDAFPAQFPARIGRSKSAQYGSVEVKLKGDADNTAPDLNYPAGRYLLVLESPLLMLNEFGSATLEIDTLGQLLKTVLQGEAEIEKVAAAFTTLEQYNTTWASKSGKHPALKEGSTFLVHLKKDVQLKEPLTYLGEWQERGFGKVKFTAFDPTLRDALLMEGKVKKSNDTATTAVPDLPLFREINDSYLQELNRVKVKTQAIADAGQFGGQFNNHQIGRMERLFQRSRTPDEIHAWIKEASDKPAGDALQKAGFVEKDRFRINPLEDQKKEPLYPLLKDDFDWQKIYWIAFFQTLRKKNKANDVQAK